MPEWVTWSCAANGFQLVVIGLLIVWLRSTLDKLEAAEKDLKTPVGRIARKTREG